MYALVRKLSNRARLEAGFGMIELVAAMTVMAIGVLAIFAMFESGMIQIKRASDVTTAAALADSEMEGYRAVRYSTIGLADSEVAATDATYKGDGAYRGDAATSLSAAVTDTATTITVTSSAGFPTTPFRILVDSEYMFVTAGAGTSTWTVVRAASGSTAAAHGSAAPVSLKARVDLPKCGTAPCTNSVPTKTATGADKRGYRVDTYMTWTLPTNAGGTPGRNLKLVTIVVRDAETGRIHARVASTFDESTGV